MMSFIYKLGLLLALLLGSIFSFSQGNSQKIYDLFSGKDGVISLSFSKSVIKPLEIFLDDDTKKVIYKMKKVSFIAYNEERGDLDALNVYDRMLKELKGNNYFRIDPDDINCDDCDIHVEGDDFVLIGHGKKNKMDEFHIVALDNESSILFSFYGDISYDDLKECSRFSSSSKGIVSF